MSSMSLQGIPYQKDNRAQNFPGQRIPYRKDNKAQNALSRESHIRSLETPPPFPPYWNGKNSSTPSEDPLDQPHKKPSCNPLRGPSPCSAVSGILGPKLQLANKPSCTCMVSAPWWFLGLAVLGTTFGSSSGMLPL